MASILPPFYGAKPLPREHLRLKRKWDYLLSTPEFEPRLIESAEEVDVCNPTYVGTVSVQPGDAEKILAAAKRERRTESGYVAKCSNESHHEQGEIARAGGALSQPVGWQSNYMITPARSRSRCWQRAGHGRVGGKELLATRQGL